MTSTVTEPADRHEVTLLDVDEEPLIISADRILGHGPGVHLRTPPRLDGSRRSGPGADRRDPADRRRERRLMPARIQRKRTAGWRAPLDRQGRKPIYVGRGTRWGNPARVVFRKDTGGWHVEHDGGASVGIWPTAAEARRFAVEVYRAHLAAHPYLAEAVREQLAGRALMCWCPTPEPGEADHCHAAVLIGLANPA